MERNCKHSETLLRWGISRPSIEGLGEDRHSPNKQHDRTQDLTRIRQVNHPIPSGSHLSHSKVSQVKHVFTMQVSTLVAVHTDRVAECLGKSGNLLQGRPEWCTALREACDRRAAAQRGPLSTVDASLAYVQGGNRTKILSHCIP
jgi:hypothetical protein